MSGYRFVYVLALIVSVAGVAWGGTIAFPLDPTSSFLLADPLDNPAAPLFISLSALRLSAGQQVTLQYSGGMSFWSGRSEDFPSQYHNYVLGVFASGNSIGTFDSRYRVTAVGSGPPEGATHSIDPATWFASLTTDIPQDFRIPDAPGGLTVTIPAGAEYLVIGTRDSYYGDNNDPNGDLRLILTAIPEPATYALILIGFGGLLALRRCKVHGRSAN